MWNSKRAPLTRAVPVLFLLLALLAVRAPALHAQSPYGLAARQTIPFVASIGTDRVAQWSTEIYVHDPSPMPFTVEPTYFGAVMTATPGRLELTSLLPIGPSTGESPDPADRIFLASARVAGPGARYFTVEGFPQGNL